MIPKAQLLERATDQDLQPTMIEKDYALGWVLYGIAQHPVASQWVFKGGTCPKKCFFDTYRFSEDLDFSIRPGDPYDHGTILTVIRELTQWVESQSGIVFPADGMTLVAYDNPRGSTSFQAKTTFVGPLQMSRHSRQRVKFDLTQDEIVVDKPKHRRISHPYTDALDPNPQAMCYSFDEVLAEKTRAIYERQGRARDVYDVVHIARAFKEAIDADRAVEILDDKFAFKNLPAPSVERIVGRIDEEILRANWKHQLGHQLPQLPDASGFIRSMPDALRWWMEPTNAAPAQPMIPGETAERTIPRESFPSQSSPPGSGMAPLLRGAGAGAIASSLMHRISYGARNHLCLRLSYNNIPRLMEPYSLRRSRTEDALLYGWERQRGNATTDQIEAYNVDCIRDVEVTSTSFDPRFLVEL